MALEVGERSWEAETGSIGGGGGGGGGGEGVGGGGGGGGAFEVRAGSA